MRRRVSQHRRGMGNLIGWHVSRPWHVERNAAKHLELPTLLTEARLSQEVAPNSGHGLAACIVGPTRSLNRPEVWTSIRDNALSPAAAELGSADAFLVAKVEGSLADVSAHAYLNNDIGDISSGNSDIGDEERAATRVTARKLNAHVHFVHFDYRRLAALEPTCQESQLHLRDRQHHEAYVNQARIVAMMSFDNVQCFQMVREQEGLRGDYYALVARLRPDVQFCRPIPPLLALLKVSSKLVYAGHTDHSNFMPRTFATHYFSPERVNVTLGRCDPPELPRGYRPSEDVQWCVPPKNGHAECLLEHWVESAGWRCGVVA
jgi:hypothetical protein